MVKIGYNRFLGLNIPFVDYGQGSGYTPIQKKIIIGPGLVTSPGRMAWNAIGTTGKIAVGAIGGAGVGLAAGSLFDIFGTKKAPQEQSFAPQNPSNITNTYTTTNTETNTSSIVGDWSTNIISNSPYASLKKGSMGASATPSVNVVPQVSVIPTAEASQKGEQEQGTDWATLAAILGVALVAYGYTSRKTK